MGRVVGFDLGTTNSRIVVMEGGATRIIPSQQGAESTPSIVSIISEGERAVGEDAKRLGLSIAQNTCF